MTFGMALLYMTSTLAEVIVYVLLITFLGLQIVSSFLDHRASVKFAAASGCTNYMCGY